MRDLGGVVVDHQKPCAGQLLDDRSGLTLVVSRNQLRERGPPSRVLRPLSELGEPEEHRAHQLLLVRSAALEDLVSGVSDRAPYTTRGSVSGRGENPTVPPDPRLEQGVREQWKAAGLTLDIREHRVDQTCLESEPRCPRRALDRSAKLVGIHRPQQELMLGQSRGEPRIAGAPPVEVRPQDDHGRYGGGLPQIDQRVDEASAALLVGAEGEHLLELIDDQERRRTGRERVRQLCLRVGAGVHHDDRAVSRPAERRDDPGAHERRFPAPGRTDHGDEAGVEQAVENGGHDRFPPEEHIAVVRLECHEAAIRARARASRNRQPRGDDRPHRCSGRRVRQLGKSELRGKATIHRFGGRTVDEDLARLGDPEEPAGA